MSNQQESQPEATDGQIAEALSISRRTVIRLCDFTVAYSVARTKQVLVDKQEREPVTNAKEQTK